MFFNSFDQLITYYNILVKWIILVGKIIGIIWNENISFPFGVHLPKISRKDEGNDLENPSVPMNIGPAPLLC
jgi:hypothetical protein